MAAETFVNVLTIFCTGLVTFVVIVVGGVTLWLHHVYRKFQHIPSPPRKAKGFFTGHILNIKETRKTEGIFAAILLKWTEDIGETFVLILLGKPLLITINQDAVKEFLVVGNHPKAAMAYKDLSYFYGERFLGSGLATEVNHEVWMKWRSALNPAFHRQLLKTFMSTFNEAADDLMTSLSEQADGQQLVTLLDHINRATLDVVAQVALGMDTNSTKDPNSPFPAALSMALKGLSHLFKSHFRKHIPFLDRPFKQEVRRALRFLRSTAVDVCAERQKALDAGEPMPDDILSYLLLAKKADPSMDMETVYDNFITFFFAGQETTANSLAFAFLEIGRNPEILQRLREEVDRVLGARTLVTYEDVTKLEYCGMVLKETLRLCPPAAFTFRECAEDKEVGGLLFPKGTTVLLSTFIAGRSARSGTLDPLVFDPDRFNPNSPRKPPTYAYFPFSLGPRSCIGITFAQIEAKVLLAKFIQLFDYELDPSQSFEVGETATLRPADGTRATLSLRAH